MRKPPAGCLSDTAPGVVKRKEIVVTKVSEPARLPIPETMGANRREDPNAATLRVAAGAPIRR